MYIQNLIIMRKIINIFLILLTFCAFYSCNEQEGIESSSVEFTFEDLNFNMAFDNPIGYVDEKNQNFIEINENQLQKYWTNNLSLPRETEFNQAKLVKAQVAEGDEEYYIIHASTKDGRINISSKASLTKDGLRLLGEECSCETEDCTNFGCEVLTMCSCSSCSGVCKKKHTIKEVYSMADFQ